MLRDAARKTSTVSLAIFGLLGLVLVGGTAWMRFEQAFGPRAAWVDVDGNIYSSLSEVATQAAKVSEFTDNSIQWWAVGALFTTTLFLIWLFWHPFEELQSRLSKRATLR